MNQFSFFQHFVFFCETLFHRRFETQSAKCYSAYSSCWVSCVLFFAGHVLKHPEMIRNPKVTNISSSINRWFLEYTVSLLINISKVLALVQGNEKKSSKMPRIFIGAHKCCLKWPIKLRLTCFCLHFYFICLQVHQRWQQWNWFQWLYSKDPWVKRSGFRWLCSRNNHFRTFPRRSLQLRLGN